MRTLRPIFLIGFASCIFVFINPAIAAVLQVSTLFFFKKAQLREDQWLIPGAIAIFGAVASYISFSISISTVSSWDTYALAVSQQAIYNAVSISSTVILQFILVKSVFIAAGVQYTELQDDIDTKAKRVRDLAEKYKETRTDLTQRTEKAEHKLDEVMLELARVNKSREELINRAELAEQQLSETAEDLVKANQLITAKEESLVQASAQCRKLSQTIHILETQKSDLEIKQQKLLEELESSRQVLASKLRLIDDLLVSASSAEKALKSERKIINSLQQELESKTQLIDAHITARDQLQDQLDRILRRYSIKSVEDISNLRLRIQDLTLKNKDLISQLEYCYRQIAEFYIQALQKDCSQQPLIDLATGLHEIPQVYHKPLRYLISSNLKLQQSCRRLAYFVKNISCSHGLDLDMEQQRVDLIAYYKLRTQLLNTFGIALMGDIEHDLSALGLSPIQKPSQSSFVFSYTMRTQISLRALRESLRQTTIELDRLRHDQSD